MGVKRSYYDVGEKGLSHNEHYDLDINVIIFNITYTTKRS